MTPGALAEIDCDLLVVGGGVAGTMAAVPALEAGLKVVVCDKGKVLDNCGSVGCGVDHYLTVLESGPEWDTPEYLLKHLPELTDGIVDLAVASRVLHEMPRIFRKIESFGVDFKDAKLGTYYRVRSFGLPGAYHINFDGTEFKRSIGKHVRRGKAEILMRTMVVSLLTRDNCAYGAIAFDFRSGQWYAIRAKCIVMATGDVNRISHNASMMPFDSWHLPYNTGDGHAMGYRAGALLANMESVETTLTPKGFSTQGLNALVSLGAYFVNRAGERFMFKYDKNGENARRATIADAVISEYLLGNGPIYLDCRHLPPDMLDRMEHTLQVDRHTLPAFYEQKGVVFREQLIEVSVSELSIRRSGVYFRGSGLAVDTEAETSIENLFAAGDCATVSGGIAGAAVLGHIAGEAAVERMRRMSGALPEIDDGEVEAVRAGTMAALRRPGGVPWRDLEAETRNVVTDFVGVRRSDRGLRLALETLRALAKKEQTVCADDLHGVMRTEEAKSIRLNAELMAAASLARKETRTGSSHRRVDYPEPDDKNWKKFVLVGRGKDGPEVGTLPTDRPLSAAFERTVEKV